MSSVPATMPGTSPGATDLLAAAGPAVALGNAPANGVGAGFLALVQQALADTTGIPGTPPGTVTATTDTEARTGDPAAADPTATDDTPVFADLVNAALLAGLTLPTATAAVVPTTGSASTATTAVTAADTAPAASTSVPDATALVAPAGSSKSAGTGTDAGSDTAADSGAAPDVAPATGPATTDQTASAPTASAPTATPPAPTTTTPVGATTAPQPTAPVTSAAGTPAPNPVTTQVVDKITSMVDRGTGTHRVTMKLNPEQLGEVRVVMTVRDGAVHVRLAASEHTSHQALLEGSGELNRLLEAAGHADARITVRETGRSFSGDLSQGGSSNDWASQGSSTSDQGAGEGRASDPQDQHAGTRADHPATDGTHDSRRFAAGPTGSRSNESVTPSRVSGLDVTM